MPTYEYRCSAGHEFEQLQRMSEPPIAECPQCGASAERRISAGAGLLFKGSGFYITDYRSESYKKAAEADSGSSSGGGAKDSGSSGEGASKKEAASKGEGAGKAAAASKTESSSKDSSSKDSSSKKESGGSSAAKSGG